MLHTESVDSSTFTLLQTLMADPLLDGFFLVDGTNIALRIDHRKRNSLDLFSDTPFDTTPTKAAHSKKYNETLVRKGLCSFQDIEYEEPLMMYGSKYSWTHVEKRLVAMLLEPERVFHS